MIYKVYVTKYGVPQAGAVLDWESLASTADVDKVGDGPAFTELVNAPGWYTFEMTFGTTPFDVEELVEGAQGIPGVVLHAA